ncbi:disheveled-associated activator of morphogenesis 2 [Rhinichthys klamathensis goyatoka]|uniref:disheveled-associated activator of morphogenesis 2 n=1 Tax=Rhinichthys klamathensis goyatoka TaxID=3034132 RepID=UPI0024B50556|nr:disheveled-associated activator of morphogenesis 2 [Rhinichthys klamathensis goyatoka]
MATVPIPPPPPPPPLPPPPLTRTDSGRKHRLRNLNWERIPKERVEGRASVWSGSQDEDTDLSIDLSSLDELFGQKEGVKPDRAAGFRRSLLRSRSPLEMSVDKVTLLDSKRSMNVGIFLRQLKIAVEEIVEDVRRGAGERYGAEKLAELCKLLPDNEEEARLKKFSGDRSLLAEPDLFILLLVELPSFRMRLDVLILQQEFDPAVTSLCVAAGCLREAARELLSCPELHYILRLVLKAGNYMNAGGYAGNAAGFRISSLLKLADTKANKPGMNLLHFVAMEAVKKDKDLLMFPSRLSHVGPASRLSEESVLEDLSRLQSRVSALRVRAQADAEIQMQTRAFLEVAEVRLAEAQEELESLEGSSKALVEFFCEDDKTFRLEEACLIFHGFCHRFQRAVQENTERELQEQRRVARERENVGKRRSLALCTGLEEERGSDDLDHALQRSLSYTGSRRSLRRLSQYFLRSGERNTTSDIQQQPNSTLRDSALMRHSLQKSEETQELSTDATCGLQQDSADTGKSHSRLNTRTVPSDNAFVALGKTSITSHQQGAVNVLPLAGISPNKVLKVEKRVQDAPERLTQTGAEKDPEKKDCVNHKESQSQRGATLETDTKTDKTWTSACEANLAREACSAERENVYPRVGETLECHTLVKGLRSYESLSPTVTRPATNNHCSKWRKEREAEERDCASSPHAKDDSRLKTPTRGPTKRLMVPRGAPSNYSGIPRVHKTPADSSSASQVSRPASVRTSLMKRFSGGQNELKRNSSARQKVNAPSDTGKLKGNAVEKSKQDEDKPFVRGSPLRVSKRLAPNSESAANHTIQSPTAATTAKTIRTAIISAAKAKTNTRIPGPKIPRAAAQPLWR